MTTITTPRPRAAAKRQNRINCLRRMINVTSQQYKRLSVSATTHEQRMEVRQLDSDLYLLKSKLNDLLSR